MKLENNKAITIIALVITIIVLIILATVSISMILGNQGIFMRADQAREVSANAQTAEETTFNQLYEQIAGYMNGDSKNVETNPYIPEGASIIENTTIDTGLTIKDKSDNEWVWVVTPKEITKNATTVEEIYQALSEYATIYRKTGWTDSWYDGCGLTEIEYNNNKAKMLNSIKTYGGFWIGRYELGTIKVRNVYEGLTMDIPTIQKNKYAYNNIVCSEGQERCSILSTDKTITSSMIFGITWDLTLKFIEEKANNLGETQEEKISKLIEDSSMLGNYINVTFNIAEGKYSVDGGQNYQNIIESYMKTKNNIVLTTGIVPRNCSLNIYDLAGNMSEWTLEKSDNTSYMGSVRGGSGGTDGKRNNITSREIYSITHSAYYDLATRPILYK